MTKFFEWLKDTKNLVIFAITCIVVCGVGKYRDFGFVKFGEFELSFDFLFFVALVGAVVSFLVLIWRIFSGVCLKIQNLVLLNALKKCSSQEKDFLYNRVYENGNELQIDMNSDLYFYRLLYGRYQLWRQEYNTKGKVIKFLRSLENKKIIRNYGNQSMVIPQQVWELLVTNADEIFEDMVNNAKE